MKITLDLDETQLDYMTKALDLYSRLMAGQFDMLAFPYYDRTKANGQYQNFKDKLSELKRIAYPELSAHADYGIYHESTPQSSKITYEIYKAIRYEQCKLNPTDHYTVDSSEPLEVSGYPLPKVSITVTGK